MNFTFDVTELTEAIQRVFPSPTGVNHYEYFLKAYLEDDSGL